MSEKWSDADMARFLDAYQNYELLWNPKTELYRNLQARQAALQAIVQHINKPKMSVNDLKNKIKNIRTTYSRELATVLKSQKSGSGLDDIYIPSLVWFKQADSFLRTVTTGRRKSQSNMNSQNLSRHTEDFEDTSQQLQHVTETNSQFNSDDTTAEDEAQNRQQPHLSLNISTSKTHHALTSATRTTTELAIETPKTKRFIGKQQKRKTCEISSTSSLDGALSKLEKIANGAKIEDEFVTFGKHIANQLRQLPLQKALQIQQTFQNILTEARIQHLNSMALQTHQDVESTSESVYSPNTIEDYYSSDTQFSILSPPPQIPTSTPHMSTDNPSGDILAAALSTINNDDCGYP